MKTGIIIFLVFSLNSFCAWADDNSTVLEKLHQIPAAPADIRYLDWHKLTTLIVTSRGVLINETKPPVPFDQVLKALADLPREAWPNGRVIIYYDSPPGLSNRADQPNSTDVKKVEADLKAAAIQLYLGTSA